MNKFFKAFVIFMAVLLISIYAFYAISFGLELRGFREVIFQIGSGDVEFYANAVTLILMIVAIYIIPLILVLALIVYFLKRQRKIRTKKNGIIINK